MSNGTREQLLDAATALFAEKGFYGVSIANVADELGLTKQALLHHFGSKERLYGEVLKRISDRIEGFVQAAQSKRAEPEEQFVELLQSTLETTLESNARTRLLMRELLDNRGRAENAGSWYLKPFLEALVAMLKRVPAWKAASDADALAAVYQLLGAINYFVVSSPTLKSMIGADAYDRLVKAFPKQLERLIKAALAHPPAPRR